MHTITMLLFELAGHKFANILKVVKSMTIGQLIAQAATALSFSVVNPCWVVSSVSFYHFQIAKRASTSKKGQPAKEPGKGQLWDGLVSIILVEGKKMIPMDDSGVCVMGTLSAVAQHLILLILIVVLSLFYDETFNGFCNNQSKLINKTAI